MLDQTRLASELIARGLPPEGVAYVSQVAASPPDRKVGSRRTRNVIFEIPLPRLRVVLQAESGTGERLFVHELERRTDVLRAFDQPVRIAVQISNRRGRIQRTWYTADFLTVEEGGVVAYEIKDDHELARLCKEMPANWRQSDSGFEYLPAKKAFAELGIRHSVVPNSTLNPIRGENLRLLLAAAAEATRANGKLDRLIERIFRTAAHERCIRIGDLMDRLEIVDAFPVLLLIESRRLFVDLDHVLLSDPHQIWIALDLETAIELTASEAMLRDTLGVNTTISIDTVCHPRYLPEVLRRVPLTGSDITLRELDDEPAGVRHGIGRQARSSRSIRRYRAKFRKGGAKELVPKWGNCGRTENLLNRIEGAFLAAHIKAAKRDTGDKSTHQAYIDYRRDFEAFAATQENRSLRPVCRATYYTWWKLIRCDEDDRQKGGRRYANAEADPSDPEKRTIVATRPWAHGHIDHCQLKVYVRLGAVKGRAIVGRPWLTALVDSFTGELLGIWLGFSPPSRKACALVIRDCVRRHGRLPETIMTDGGAEFRSVHFATMLAFLRITRAERPPEDPKFGLAVERTFGAFRQRFLRGLPGHGISIERARAISAAFRADKRSELTPKALLSAIETFVFHGYNVEPRASNISAPEDIRLSYERKVSCSGRAVDWDQKFLVATAIEAPEATYRLHAGRGLTVDRRWYSAPALSRYRGWKRDLAVRLEPFDDSVIYVCVEKSWIVCRANGSNIRAVATLASSSLASMLSAELRATIRALKADADRHASELLHRTMEAVREQNAKAAASQSPAPPEPAVRDYAPIDFDAIEQLEIEEEAL